MLLCNQFQTEQHSIFDLRQQINGKMDLSPFEKFLYSIREDRNFCASYQNRYGISLSDFLPTIDIVQTFLEPICRKPVPSKLSKLVGCKVSQLNRVLYATSKTLNRIYDFTSKCQLSQKSVIQLIRQNWTSLIHGYTAKLTREQLKQYLLSLFSNQQVGLCQKDVCHLLMDQKLIQEQEKYFFVSGVVMEEVFDLKEDQIDFKQTLRVALEQQASQPAFYFMTKDRENFTIAFENMLQNPMMKKLLDELFDNDYAILELLDSLLSLGPNQNNFTIAKRTLQIISLISYFQSRPHLKQFVKETVSRLFYLCYYRCSLSVFTIILKWMGQVQELFTKQLFQIVVLPHFLILFEINSSKRHFKTQQRIKALLQSYIREINIHPIYGWTKSSLLAEYPPKQQHNYSEQRLISDIKKQLKRLDFARVYLILKAVKNKIVRSLQNDQNGLNKRRQIMVGIQNVITTLKESSKRCYCQKLVDLLFGQVNGLLQYIAVNNVPFEKDLAHPLTFMYLEEKQFDIRFNVENLKGSQDFALYKLTTLYRIRVMNEKCSLQPSQYKLQHPRQQQSLVMEDSSTRFAWEIVQNFGLKILTEDRIEQIKGVLLTRQPRIVLSLFLNLLRWVFGRLLQAKSKSKAQYISLQKQIIDFFSNLITLLAELSPSDNPLNYIFLHGYQYCERWEQTTKKCIQGIGLLYFQILQKNTQLYGTIASVYTQLNSLRHAAFFNELNHLKNKAPNCVDLAYKIYSRLRPDLKNVSMYSKQSADVQKRDQFQQMISKSSWVLQLFRWYISSIPTNKTKYAERQLILNIIKQSKLMELHDSEEINYIFSTLILAKKIFATKFPCQEKDRPNFQQIKQEEIKKLPSSEQRIAMHWLRYYKRSTDPFILDIRRTTLLAELLQEGKLQMLAHFLNFEKGVPLERRHSSELRIIAHYFMRIHKYERAMMIAHTVKDRIGRVESRNSENCGIVGQMIFLYVEICSKKANKLNFDLRKLLEQMSLYIKFLEDRQITDEESDCIFKMLRLAFEEFPIWKPLHERLLLHQLLAFRKKISFVADLPKKDSLLKKYFIAGLKFILQRFSFTPQMAKNAVEWSRNILVPEFLKQVTHYLIRMISPNLDKSGFIFNMLKIVAQNYPAWSAWWISSLCNHQLLSPKDDKELNKPRYFDLLDQHISHLGKELKASAKPQTRKYVDWITQFTKKLFETKDNKNMKFNKKIPKNLCNPFDMGKILNGEVSIEGFSEQGKSRPLFVSMLYENQKRSGRCSFILKYNLVHGQEFRMEYKSANFFKDLGMIDAECTYSIAHLGKFILMIEKVQQVISFKDQIKKTTPAIENLIFPPIDKKKYKQNCQYYDYHSNFQTNLYQRVFACNSIDQWWTKFNNYAQTTAQWSFAGAICGLGDRHFNNIMLLPNCKVVHIDFQYNLDKGRDLPFPQWIPFRLTKAIRNPMGALQAHGLFFCYFVQAVKELERNEEQFEKALSHFSDDYRSIDIIAKIRLRAKFQGFNTIEEGVYDLIQRAQDTYLQRDLFMGWEPWV